MKQRTLTLLFAMLAFVMFTLETKAQVLIPTDNLAIFRPNTVFDPTQKFVALGESGGVQGPTPTGCDLYGFRAQLAPELSVNLGMQEATVGGVIGPIPTLSFESKKSPFIIQQVNTSQDGTGEPTGCGKPLAWYYDGKPFNPGSDIVYTVFGSAFASGGNWIPSDASLKKNIKPIKNAMDIVQQLNGVTYKYRADEYADLGLSTRGQYGFIAQDVEKVMPEAIQAGVTPEGFSDDYIAMNYDMIIPVLTEAIKIQQEEIDFQRVQAEEQQSTIESMQREIAELRALITGEEAPRDNSTQDRVMLGQNRPNPTDGFTTIDYDLGAESGIAQLVVYNAAGAIVKQLSLANGNGSVEINTNELAAGVYFYTLESNGKNLARQKMVIK